MLERFFKDPQVLDRLRDSKWKHGLDLLAEYLSREGYSQTVAREYIRGAGHFAHWVERSGIGRRALDENAVAQFLRDHSLRCRCPVPIGRRGGPSLGAGIRHFLRLLRDSGCVPMPRRARLSATDRWLADFDTHLRDVCGARPKTRAEYMRNVRQFLESRPPRSGVRGIQPIDVVDHVTQRARTCKPKTAKLSATSLRAFFRFLRIRGVGDARLIEAVPTIPEWKLATLPRILSDSQIDTLLAAFDTTTAMGRRDYAIAVCLVDLGLRACEVAGLTLDDVDWRRGVLQVGMIKVRRRTTMPMPPRVGRAFADYVRHARPRVPERQIFVRHSAPAGRPLSSSGVRKTIRVAGRRAGLPAPCRGTHALRHTAATRLLRSGASLKEIADLLGHRSIDTTVIYTKLDLDSLHDVALPWPKEVR